MFSFQKRWLMILLLGQIIIQVAIELVPGIERQQEIPRVRRPKFTEQDVQNIYFSDFWRDALQGARPAKNESPSGTLGDPPPESNDPSHHPTPSGWSQLVTAAVVEDEIKAIHQRLQRLVTSPSQFNTSFMEVRQNFGLLTTWFAIVHEYESDIRWKNYALTASQMFAEANATTRSASRPAFENAKNRVEDLGELIRGGTIALSSSATNAVDWSEWVGRNELMIRLEDAFQNSLRPAIAHSMEFQQRESEFSRSVQIVAALANVLSRDGVEGSDDESYVLLADNMKTIALDLQRIGKDGNFDEVASRVNQLEKSCNECHAEWR